MGICRVPAASHASNEDSWVMMSGGWVVRIHRSPRSHLFHPIHRSHPVQPQDLEAQRVTEFGILGPAAGNAWCRKTFGRMDRCLQRHRSPELGGAWTFFRLAESPQSGNSSGIPRIQPDSIVWNPDENSGPHYFATDWPLKWGTSMCCGYVFNAFTGTWSWWSLPSWTTSWLCWDWSTEDVNVKFLLAWQLDSCWNRRWL